MDRLTRLGLLAILFSSANIASAIPISLQPGTEGKDAQLVSDIASTNFGNREYITDNWAGNFRSIGLVQFDLSSIGASSINSASLDLFHVYNGNLGSTYSIFRVTSDWDEQSVNFSSAPSFDPVAVASLTIKDSNMGVFRSWDVTSLVSGWASGQFANYGLWIEEVPVQGAGTAYFASSDTANHDWRPRLNVDYSPAAVPEPDGLALFGFGLVAVALARRRSLSKAE